MINFRFAIASDLHIALPHTVNFNKPRFHLVEASIPIFESVLNHLEKLDLDFLLLPGDLTQDGEPDNHKWLQKRLETFPFPVYVIPGNHDVLTPLPSKKNIGFHEFPQYYRKAGYENCEKLYYSREILPNVQLIALNSNQFDAKGKQLGCLDTEQLEWLDRVLLEAQNKFILVMIHHNVIEHLPDQSQHPMGKRYMLDNAPILLEKLRKAGVQLIFSGHLHVQDIAEQAGIYDIVTGSTVGYPHPYRLLQFSQCDRGTKQLKIESFQIENVPNWQNLPQISRERIGEHSYPFMHRLLTLPPLNLAGEEAENLARDLRYFWADVSAGDRQFNFSDYPESVRTYLESFGAIDRDRKPLPIDNNALLVLQN
ncbi:metallophosphoesterase [Spirulina sp. 06S082]|uniref:metallophosphoesterase family protein n=1 Tax=Spirulina sp. 06S082 TaxID=3110248 RepID=UPI002B1F4560|nr:metallophosphoesterase [Spirulina sp. 06S082]MEA5468857.1 metallophosphoesterase [Spirulina sp. 06S082]